MNELKVYSPGLPSDKDSYAVSFVKMVKLNLAEAQKSFFEIGFRLCEAQNNKYYQELGFESLVDCAEFHFGFKKTTTYELIDIYKAFHDPNCRMLIKDKYKDFSSSQLSVLAPYAKELTYYNEKFLKLVRPVDSVRKIKRAFICYKAIYNYKCSHIPYPSSTFSTLDGVINYVENYTLSDFNWIKVNYPKVITPELEEKYNSTRKETNALVDISDTVEHGQEQFQECEIIASDSENEHDEIIELLYKEPGIEFSGVEKCEPELELAKETSIESLKNLLYDKLFTAALNLFEPGNSPDSTAFFANKVCSMLFYYIQNNKMAFVDYLYSIFDRYDYIITLNGRKQNLKVFISNLLKQIVEVFYEQ